MQNDYESFTQNNELPKAETPSSNNRFNSGQKDASCVQHIFFLFIYLQT